MTIQDFYYRLGPHVVQFAEDSQSTQDPVIHAANSIACYLMRGLQNYDDDNDPSFLLNLAILIRLNDEQLGRQ